MIWDWLLDIWNEVNPWNWPWYLQVLLFGLMCCAILAARNVVHRKRKK